MKILDGQKGKRCDEATYLTYTHKRCPCCREIKVVSLFYKKIARTARGWAWDSRCIECSRGQCRSYSASNRETRNARLRQWRKKNPESARRHDKNGRLKQKYGLSIEKVEKMRTAQNGKCAICGKETKRLFVDHCHTKGHVRALICQTCNTFLCWYEKKADTIIKFQEYIAAHAE